MTDQVRNFLYSILNEGLDDTDDFVAKLDEDQIMYFDADADDYPWFILTVQPAEVVVRDE